MAVNATKLSRTLRIGFENGVNASGNALTKYYSISGIKAAASDEACFETGKALAGLYDLTLAGIRLQEVTNLTPAA